MYTFYIQKGIYNTIIYLCMNIMKITTYELNTKEKKLKGSEKVRVGKMFFGNLLKNIVVFSFKEKSSVFYVRTNFIKRSKIQKFLRILQTDKKLILGYIKYTQTSKNLRIRRRIFSYLV